MHFTYHFASHQVYAKTEKGKRELVRPQFGLDSRQRRVLTGIDGIRNLRMLIEFCPEQELEDILGVLMKQDFIIYLWENDSDSASLSNSPGIRAIEKADADAIHIPFRSSIGKHRVITQDFARFLAAKELMLEVAVVHLGILGRDIMQKIERANTPHSLLMLAGRWNMALCESKSASRYASLYLEKVKLILLEE